MEPAFIPIKDVPTEMGRLGVPLGLSTVKRLVASGELGSATIARRRKVAVQSIRDYVAKRLAEAGVGGHTHAEGTK